MLRQLHFLYLRTVPLLAFFYWKKTCKDSDPFFVSYYPPVTINGLDIVSSLLNTVIFTELDKEANSPDHLLVFIRSLNFWFSKYWRRTIPTNGIVLYFRSCFDVSVLPVPLHSSATLQGYVLPLADCLGLHVFLLGVVYQTQKRERLDVISRASRKYIGCSCTTDRHQFF